MHKTVTDIPLNKKTAQIGFNTNVVLDCTEMRTA